MPPREQIRSKIADLQGYMYEPDDQGAQFFHPAHWKLKRGDDIWEVVEPPDWPGDLNASHELPVRDIESFVHSLQVIMFGQGSGFLNTEEMAKILFATAEQWSIAWILYNKWRWNGKSWERLKEAERA